MIKKYLHQLYIFTLSLFIPFTTRAQGLVPCDGINDKCGIEDIIELVNNVITFLIQMFLPIAAIALVVGGFIYMTGGEDPGKRKVAVAIFKNIVIGLVIVLSAWLIVYTLFNTLGVSDDYHMLDPGN